MKKLGVKYMVLKIHPRTYGFGYEQINKAGYKTWVGLNDTISSMARDIQKESYW